MNALRIFLRLKESVIAVVGFSIVLFWILIAIFADIVSPFGPLEQILPMAKPGATSDAGIFLLGTDFLGRDILSRIIHGTRTIMLWGAFGDGVRFCGGDFFWIGRRLLRRAH